MLLNPSVDVTIEVIELIRMCYIDFISCKYFYVRTWEYNHDFDL